MNIKLAKQLRDSGFRHIHGAGCYEFETDECIPSLSELIEACGEDFVTLRNWQREYKRFGNKIDEDGQPYVAESNRIEASDEGTQSWISENGSTPEEAVAKLWLALNKNK